MLVAAPALADDVDERESQWKTCIETKAIEFAPSNESAAEAARIAALACRSERSAYQKAMYDAVAPRNLETFRQARETAEADEARLIELATVLVVRTRLNLR